jgi:hypothetical protein
MRTGTGDSALASAKTADGTLATRHAARIDERFLGIGLDEFARSVEAESGNL